MNNQLNIAVVGSGISGLSAAWLLAKRHRVTLYEAEGHIGGHANTYEIAGNAGKAVAVDTGFIVYNEQNYPNLTALFSHLEVPTNPTEMTFAFSADDGAYEYSGTGLHGFFGQWGNAARRVHWRLLRDISRFFREAPKRINAYPDDIALGRFLTAEGYSETFVEDHIVPMGAAIWSTPATAFLDFPARSFLDFYANHGMLQFVNRPDWRTVAGGSREYVARILGSADIDVQKGVGVSSIVRHPGYVHVVDQRGVDRAFDQIVIATHPDQALALLDQPEPRERDLLGAFSYQRNQAVLHRDPSLMPKRRRLWSAWNYLKSGRGHEADLCVTYWMNELQDLTTAEDIFVTLNPHRDIDPARTEAIIDYDHPVFDASAMAAQRHLWDLQGVNRTWFCGAYFGYGFHEDGAQSGLAVAEQLGGVRRPWDVTNESGRIPALVDIPALQAAE